MDSVFSREYLRLGGEIMERLTKRDSYGDVYVKQHDYVTASERIAECEGFEDFEEIFRKKMTDTASERLCEYEDLEEQGLLLRLPVPIGTTVYEFEPLNKTVKECTKRTVIKYTVYDDSIWFNFADGYMKDIKDFGKTVFLTKEEAEQKLKEMEIE